VETITDEVMRERMAQPKSGAGIFNGPPDEVSEIMDGGPGLQAGIFPHEGHQMRGFPGSCLPG
jgi:hypothetical protein